MIIMYVAARRNQLDVSSMRLFPNGFCSIVQLHECCSIAHHKRDFFLCWKRAAFFVWHGQHGLHRQSALWTPADGMRAGGRVNGQAGGRTDRRMSGPAGGLADPDSRTGSRTSPLGGKRTWTACDSDDSDGPLPGEI